MQWFSVSLLVPGGKSSSNPSVSRSWGGESSVWEEPTSWFDFSCFDGTVCHRVEKHVTKLRGWFPSRPVKFDNSSVPDLEGNQNFTAPFSRSRIHQWVWPSQWPLTPTRGFDTLVTTPLSRSSFIITNRETFFNNATKSRIVHHILQRVRYEDGKNKMGTVPLSLSEYSQSTLWVLTEYSVSAVWKYSLWMDCWLMFLIIHQVISR